MKFCPITYEIIKNSERYSNKGLRQLSAGLKALEDFPYTAEEQRKEAEFRSSKMSIQGVQPKLSAILAAKENQFKVVDHGGRYILKPQIQQWNYVPENEDLTMRLASTIGIETPFHGLIHSKDGTKTYFTRRYDRKGQKDKVHVEDFAQLGGESRDTKYKSSMERVAEIIEFFCTFPAVEKLKLFKRTLFSFIVGNEDMHLKNFSLIVKDDKTELTPAYDLVNTTIVIENPKEELALPIAGKKRNLNKKDLIEYFAQERLGLTESVCSDTLTNFEESLLVWENLIDRSFLQPIAKKRYLAVIIDRFKRLDLNLPEKYRTKGKQQQKANAGNK